MLHTPLLVTAVLSWLATDITCETRCRPTGCNTTGPPSCAAPWWVTLHIGELQTTTDDDRHQREQYWPPYTMCKRASNNCGKRSNLETEQFSLPSLEPRHFPMTSGPSRKRLGYWTNATALLQSHFHPGHMPQSWPGSETVEMAPCHGNQLIWSCLHSA